MGLEVPAVVAGWDGTTVAHRDVAWSAKEEASRRWGREGQTWAPPHSLSTAGRLPGLIDPTCAPCPRGHHLVQAAGPPTVTMAEPAPDCLRPVPHAVATAIFLQLRASSSLRVPRWPSPAFGTSVPEAVLVLTGPAVPPWQRAPLPSCLAWPRDFRRPPPFGRVICSYVAEHKR